LEDNKISISKVAQKIGKGITVTKEYIKKLKTKGRIKHIGPAKGGHWEITK
jgi:ATP-dependent DNA helicase RecG